MDNEDPGVLEDKIKKVLKTIIDYYEDEEKQEREEIVREFRQLDLYFRGFQDLALSKVSRDWVDLSTGSKRTSDNPNDRTYRNRKIINVQRADIESIIAALSATIPTTKFFPTDADNPLDIQAASHYDLTAEKLKNDNGFALKFIYALYVYLNQGLVYWYTYHEKSDEYGVKQSPVYGESDPLIETKYACDSCGAEIEAPGPQVCLVCKEEIDPIPLENPIPQEPVITDFKEEPNGKTCIELYGPLHVKAALSARKLKESPYLYLYSDISKALALENYPKLVDIEPGDGEKDNRWARRFSPDQTKSNDTLVKKKCFLRPWALNCELKKSPEEIKKLRGLYPKGLLVTLIEDHIVEIEEYDIDSHWEATEPVVSHFMHNDPHARQVKPLQDLENESVRMTTAILGHIIPERWADPEHVDFAEYAKTPNEPGLLNPVSMKRATDMGKLFYQSQPASMPKELPEFQNYLNQRRQFVSGATPTIYGGQLKGGSGTFGEYEMSRNLSLQRLGLPWKVLLEWIPRGMLKSCKIHQEEMSEEGDTEVVQEGGGFANKTIPKAIGSVGKAIAETSEQFPTTWPQLRGMLLELMGLGKEYIDAAIVHPENIEFVSKLLGFGGMHIPGKKDRDKQLMEIRELLMSGPITDEPNPNFQMPTVDPMGMPMMDMNQFMPPHSSVPVEQEIDNHAVQLETIKVWALSEPGLDAKVNNPEGYANVVMHGAEHKQAIMMQQMEMQGGMPGGPMPQEDVGAEDPENMQIDESVGLQ